MSAVRLVNVVGAAEGADWFVPMCAGLAARGHQVSAIIDARPGGLGAQLDQAGIPLHRVDLSLSRPLAAARAPARAALDAARLAQAAARVAGVLRRVRPDAILTHHFNATLLGRLAGVTAGVPLRMSMAPSPFTLEAPVTRGLDRATWRADHVLIAGSERIRTLYEGLGVPRSRLEVVYYGAPAERFDPRSADRVATRAHLGISADVPLIGHVAHFYAPIGGRFAPPAARGRGIKGHEVLLRALPTVLAARPDARARPGGRRARRAGRSATASRCRASAASLGVAHAPSSSSTSVATSRSCSARWTSRCSRRSPRTSAARSSRCSWPRRRWPAGSAGMPEAVHHEQTGLLVAPDDPAQLAAAILRLLAEPELAARLGRDGRALMLERFTFERTVDDLDRIVRERSSALRG